LDLPGQTLEIDDEYMAGYFTNCLTEGVTPCKNIHAVPAGNFLSARNGKISLQRFWSLDPAKEIRYRTDQEYEEHFVQLFSDAVRVRPASRRACLVGSEWWSGFVFDSLCSG
jgi:asparagine synthase (glutamine-hydrolysing)